MFRHSVLVSVGCSVLLFLACPGYAEYVSRKNPFTEAIAKTRSSVVSIKAQSPRASRPSVGSGVIIDERGYIVTNRHVVGVLKQARVILADETEYAGQVIFTDAANDLAVLKINADKKLPYLTLAPVSDLMLGETVIAIGNPYGYDGTVTTGIISALNRKITMPNGENLTGLIQHSAPINPGNSGGPLLNINGEWIGVNVAVRDGAQCIAFTINADTVRQILSERLSALKIAGVSHGLNTTEKVIAETGDRQRLVVAELPQQSPAIAAGLQKGDVIRAVSGRSVVNSFDLERALWDKKAGQTVQLRVVRGGQELTVNLTLSEGPGLGQTAAAPATPAARSTTNAPVNFRD